MTCPLQLRPSPTCFVPFGEGGCPVRSTAGVPPLMICTSTHTNSPTCRCVPRVWVLPKTKRPPAAVLLFDPRAQDPPIPTKSLPQTPAPHLHVGRSRAQAQEIMGMHSVLRKPSCHLLVGTLCRQRARAHLADKCHALNTGHLRCTGRDPHIRRMSRSSSDCLSRHYTLCTLLQSVCRCRSHIRRQWSPSHRSPGRPWGPAHIDHRHLAAQRNGTHTWKTKCRSYHPSRGVHHGGPFIIGAPSS